jgi:glucose-6-phosphate 1-dehydrogenase
MDKIISPLVFVIFGATGDLTRTKLLPALYSLYRLGKITHNFFILGVSRREIAVNDFREMMRLAAQSGGSADFNSGTWAEFADGIDYEPGYFENPDLYQRIVGKLKRYDKLAKACVPRFFYLSTAPEHYAPILEHLHNSGLSAGCGQLSAAFTRVLIEKPFGRDLETAAELENQLSHVFSEKQIFRIDHYLGKETVQNILAFRFANGIFDPTWNRQFIDHVQITLDETVGVGTRGAFYDGIGALRDVVQNHMLEMLALMAIEQPIAFNEKNIRDEKIKILEAIKCIKIDQTVNNTVRGQYQGNGKLLSFIKEKNVSNNSNTETFVALKLFVENDRWDGVPFYLRTGKRLNRKLVQISVHYKKPVLCKQDVCFYNPTQVLRNVLAIKIQPHEGIDLRVMVKEPGFGMKLTPIQMKFRYNSEFSGTSKPDAYARLLIDAIAGDQTLFARSDGIAASWKLMMSIREGWESARVPLQIYKSGSTGPAAAEELINRDGRHWI